MTRIAQAIAILLGLWLATGAQAETVAVQSGEHDGFSRLVLTFAAPVDWQMTRRSDGYALTVDRADLRYDLSQVYSRIARQRLAAIWADPDSGALRLGVACACHALPFEYRPGVLVIDLRDGPPPPGSSFEAGPTGERMAALTARVPVRPRARPGRPARSTLAETEAAAPAGYDWLDLAVGSLAPAFPLAGLHRPAPQRAPFRAPDSSGMRRAAPDLADLRRALLYDLARGAARGAVDLALPARTGQPAPAGGDPAQVAVHQADALPLAIGLRSGDDGAALAADGTACLSDAALDLSAWGDARPVAQAIGPLTGSLFGEFDRVDTDAAERAVRYLLSLGFGAEAAARIAALDLRGEAVPVWASLARILDGDTDPEGAFRGMAACDTAAALWAALARRDLPPGAGLNTAAALRAFSALPPHLRRHLGPPLADRLLARGDTAAVRAVLQAMQRAPGGTDAGAALVDAGLAAATGAAPDIGALTDLRQATGPAGVMATVALMRTALGAGQAVDPALIAEAEARLVEFAGTPDAAPLQQTLAEAQASQGNFARAFALTGRDGPGAAPVWAILAASGGVTPLLDYAILRGDTAPPTLPDKVRRSLAARLIDLGFARPALVWLGIEPAPGTLALPQSLSPEDRLLAARAALIERDTTAAERLLAGLSGPEAEALRLDTLSLRGDPAAVPLAEAAGNAATTAALARRTRDWPRVARDDADPWRAAARRAADVPDPAADPLLARSRALVAESAAARADLSALLAATALPASAP